MYEFLKGKLVELNPSFAIIDVSDIGYFVNISLNTYSKLMINTVEKLFIHQVIREDANFLFGFYDKEEREVFRLLISVSGIGPNTARMMFSSLTTEEIRKAILEGDVNTLKSVKGIGLKTAQRVIVDLKDKIGKISVGEEFSLFESNTVKEESLSGLVMLGFNRKLAEKAIENILKLDKNISVEELIKKALKSL
jgi:Holliday junction DNA helicase RuvA